MTFGNYGECSVCHSLSDEGGADIIKDDEGNFICFGQWMCLDCLEDHRLGPGQVGFKMKRLD